MRWPLTPILLATLAAGAVLWWTMAPASRTTAGREAPSPAAALAALRFVPNLGQWHDEVRYAALGDTVGWLHDDGFSLRFERWAAPAETGPAAAPAPREQTGCVVRTRFVGGAATRFVPGRELSGRQNFCLGADRARWRSDVPGFATVCMAGVLPGIDVVFRPLPDGRRGPFEYDLVLAPGADLGAFTAVCEGVDALALDAEGRLHARLTTPDGAAELVQEAPVAWQDTPAGRVPLRVTFRLLGTRSYGFAAADLDPSWPTTVDPGVVWGTFLGGGATDSINDLHWKPGVGIWVAGWAGSTDFPTTVGAYRTTGGTDAFVARLQEDGSALVYSTYLGGVGGEEARGIAIGPADTASVVGFTASADFPVTPGALQPAFGGTGPYIGVGDGFLVRFTPNGGALLAATYLGGSGDDVAEDVAVDQSGNAVVVGFTFSADFPTTAGAWRPAFSSAPNIDSDGFVARIAANAQSLAWSTFVGGLFSEQLLEVDLDPVGGDVVVAGWTLSSDFPTSASAYRTTSSGAVEAVITRLQPAGSGAVFSTYLGGIGAESAHDVRVAADGTVWVAGRTNSTNFPVTPNAPQRSLGGDYDGFVSRLGATGQTLLFSTLHGGPGADSVRSLDVGAVGAVVVGEAGAGFPVTANPIQAQFEGGSLDGFVSFLDQGGTALAYSSYLGGADQDMLNSVQLDVTGIAVLAGWTFSADFPVAPAGLQGTLRGVQDGVVLKIDLLDELGEGVAVAAPPSAGPSVVAPGTYEVLAAIVENLTSRAVTIEAVQLLAAGAGDTPLHVHSLRAWLELPGVAAPILVAGPTAVPADDAEFELALTGAVLPANAVGVLRLECDLAGDPQGDTVELACAIVDRGAWRLRADGAGVGPAVRVLGTGRAAGPVLVQGALPGDADGDGEATIYDLRQLLQQLGAAVPAIDCDGDSFVTPADIALLRETVLGRPGFVGVPGAVTAGGWFTVRGVFAGGLVEATLGGRVLTLGQVTTREITLRVDAAQPKGMQVLTVLLGGRTVFAGAVLVQ